MFCHVVSPCHAVFRTASCCSVALFSIAYVEFRRKVKFCPVQSWSSRLAVWYRVMSRTVAVSGFVPLVMFRRV